MAQQEPCLRNNDEQLALLDPQGESRCVLTPEVGFALGTARGGL